MLNTAERVSRAALGVEGRLKKAIAKEPKRYQAVTDRDGVLVQCLDHETGRVYVRAEQGWDWIE